MEEESESVPSVLGDADKIQQLADEDSEDRWSITCNKGSNMDIQDALLDDPETVVERPHRTLHAYENLHLQRTRSQINRTRRNIYENTDVAPLIRRHSEILPNSKTSNENAEIRPESLSECASESTQSSSPAISPFNCLKSEYVTSDARRNAQRRSLQYENVPALEDPTSADQISTYVDENVKLSRHLTLDRKSKIRLGLVDDESAEEVFHASQSNSIDSDDSYITDSDFDSDEDDAFDLFDDRISITSEGSLSSEYPTNAQPREKIKEMIRELVTAERAYVDRLHFLCRVVLLNLKILHRVQEVHSLPIHVMDDIFPCVEDLYAMHAAHVLPRFLSTLEQWDESPVLSCVFNDLLPQLTRYILHAEKYNKACQLYETWLNKNPVFNALISEVQKTPECSRLTVSQHMLDIVHRIPKYQAMLKGYVESLPMDAKDKESAADVLSAMTALVTKLEHAMGKDERLKKLKEIENRLDINVVTPTREFIREGKMKTIAPISGRKIDRFIFLFNDLLVICIPPAIGSLCRVKFSIPMESTQVYDGDNLAEPHTFYVQGKRKAFEFCAKNLEVKQEWIEAIESAVEQSTRWKLSSKPLDTTAEITGDLDLLGQRIPELIPMGQVSSCPLCKAHLGRIRRKHHCRACGQVVCASCSQKKAQLDYDKLRWGRVCDECYVILRNRELDVEEAPCLHEKVCAESNSLISGELQVSQDGGEKWHSRIMALHTNGYLYCFKQKQAADATICERYLPLMDKYRQAGVQ